MVNEVDGNATGPVGPELLGRLVDHCAAALVLYARQFCDCPEDVVQEAFIQLAGQTVTPEEATAWLYRVVRNRAISVSRSDRRRRRRESEAAGRNPPWLAGSADDALDARSAAAALDKLPQEQREVVVAHIWGGMSFRQIGSLTGTSDSTAHRRYVAALATLRERLGVPCPKQK